MNEQMEFPETFEEFAKEYGFKDDKEVYTNGSDLISIFRVKQWLEHDNKLRRIETDTAYEDVIRREDALQALCKAVHKNDDTIPCPNQRVSCLWNKTRVQEYAEEIWKIPPVTPQPKIGHWVDKDGRSAICSCCSLNNTLFGNYCKWCGAKMED